MRAEKVFQEIDAGRLKEIAGTSVTRFSTERGTLTRSRCYITKNAQASKRSVIQLETESEGFGCASITKTQRVYELKGADLLLFLARYPQYFTEGSA